MPVGRRPRIGRIFFFLRFMTTSKLLFRMELARPIQQTHLPEAVKIREFEQLGVGLCPVGLRHANRDLLK